MASQRGVDVGGEAELAGTGQLPRRLGGMISSSTLASAAVFSSENAPASVSSLMTIPFRWPQSNRLARFCFIVSAM